MHDEFEAGQKCCNGKERWRCSWTYKGCGRLLKKFLSMKSKEGTRYAYPSEIRLRVA